MRNKIYLTTTLAYANSAPHLGFAAELVQADIIARHYLSLGHEVFLNTGTDEHGLNIYRRAQAAGLAPQVFVDQQMALFRDLLNQLSIWPAANFIRTTDSKHLAAAQEFWRRCLAAGDIYPKNYQAKYCPGCEMVKPDSELERSRCFLHPNLELEIIEEENYFFRFSKYQQPLLKLYAENPEFVRPNSRLHEIKSFVERGLEDFSISRLANKMPWGIPVPNDSAHVTSVWFDALVNYISAIGWPDELEKFNSWWPVIQFAGKDNLRQQAALWQAMLMSANLPSSKQIIIHGFLTSAGQKMSKSLGNVINPSALIAEYGADAVRYYLARHIQPFEDSDVTLEKFKEAYNANLANGLGNLVSRIMKMATTCFQNPIEMTQETRSDTRVAEYLKTFEFNRALDSIWERIGHNDALIAVKKPFVGIKSKDANIRDESLLVVKKLVRELNAVAIDLEPFMPTTSATIKQLVREHKMPDQPLFPRR